MRILIAAVLLLCASAASFGATVIYVQTIGGLIYKSTDSGTTWQPVGVPIPSDDGFAMGGEALAVDPQNPNKLYSTFAPGTREIATQTQPGLFRSADGGNTWAETVILISPTLIAVDPTMDNIVYLNGPSPMRSTDYGVTFQSSTAPSFANAIKPDPTQPGVLYLAGHNGDIYKSTDYGVTWAVFVTDPLVTGQVLDFAIDPTRSGVMYIAVNAAACGKSETPCGLVQSTDSGQTWQSVYADAFGSVVVDPRNGNVYAGGFFGGSATASPSGEVVKSTDGGKTFTKSTTGLTRLGVIVHLDPESPNVLYGSQGPTVGSDQASTTQPAGVFVSTDSGTTWKLSTVDPALKVPSDQVYSFIAINYTAPAAGVVNTLAAGGRTDLFAPDSIVSAFGSALATGSAGASTNPPPTNLAGATVTVTDSTGNSQPAELLYVSPAQINYIVPDGLAAGAATVAFNSGSSTQTQAIQLGPVAPGMFAFNAAGLAAGSVLRVSGDGAQTAESFFQTDSSGNVTALPIDLAPATDQVFLILYGTGFRAAGTANTTVTIGGHPAQVSFAGAQGAFAGLDQVNVLIPPSLAGSGTVSIVLTASGQAANTVNVSVE